MLFSPRFASLMIHSYGCRIYPIFQCFLFTYCVVNVEHTKFRIILIQYYRPIGYMFVLFTNKNFMHLKFKFDSYQNSNHMFLFEKDFVQIDNFVEMIKSLYPWPMHQLCRHLFAVRLFWHSQQHGIAMIKTKHFQRDKCLFKKEGKLSNANHTVIALLPWISKQCCSVHRISYTF